MTDEYRAGSSATLSATFAVYPGGPNANLTGVTIEIEPLAGGASVIGPTSTGVSNPATGVYAYAWSIPSDTDLGDYLVTWSGTDSESDTVTATEIIEVTAYLGELYCDRATLKTHLGISNDTTRDGLLDDALAAASRYIDRLTGRRFYADDSASARVYRPHRRVVRDSDGDRLLIDDVSSLTGLVVEVGSVSAGVFTGSTLTAYETGPDNALVQYEPVTWLLATGSYWTASPYTRVRVTARWGWPAVPDEIAQATKLQAGRLFKRKDSPEGVAGSADWGVVRVTRVDPDVMSLIQPFVLPGFG